MVIYETEVLEVIERTSDVKSFRFKPDASMEFKAGQFFFVSIMVEGKESTKHFSFSNSPTEKDYIEFTKRITDSDFSKALSVIKPGDWAKLKGPSGSFTINESDAKIAFLSGGIGITPIRSMIKFAYDNNISNDMVLFYGNKTESNIAFKNDFDQIAKSYNRFKVVYTLSNDHDNLSWPGKRGHIDRDMISSELPDYNQRTFYICGPPAMVGSLTKLLKEEMDIADKNIVIENFTGY